VTDIDRLRAVHHPVRRRILDHLHLHGPAQVGTLAHALDQQVGSISHHLRMLQRAGVVEPAPELATDGRASWWRPLDSAMTWSVDDFDTPGERAVARAAERANIDYELNRLSAWKRVDGAAPVEWRRAAFATQHSATATAAELADLMARLNATLQEWDAAVDRTDGAEREPVFFFAHGFPARA
jgi:DNA-binding transcriptional ArsR family regulator